MTFRLSRKAVDDIANLYATGVEQFGRAQAEHYFEGLHRAFASLEQFP
jgi:plasmid stabilization system protein ParE